MRTKLFILSLAAALLMAVAPAAAQKIVQVRVAPENADWTYKTGEKLKFNVEITKDNIALKGVEVEYELAEEMMPPFKTGSEKLRDGRLTIDAGTSKKAGFVRCKVTVRHDGYRYEGMATAGFDPYSIEPVTTDPADFDRFWADAKAELAKVAVNPILTLIPERCTAKSDVYHVSLQNINNSRVYGILCVPKKPGKYPAILNVPGAGIRPYTGDMTSDEGYITLQIGIHGVPVNLPQQTYTDLANGPLNHYMTIKLDDRDNYYYKRVYLGCVRAIDFLTSMEQFDGRNMFVRGGSQGGALSIVSAGLDSRVTAISAYYPALCDIVGYMHGRAGGWPHLFRTKDDKTATKERIETTYYYDVVNFARRVNAPGFYSMGYNDVTCPPTSMFAAYNVIPAEKQILVVPETGHFLHPEQGDRSWKWLRGRIK